MAAKLVVLGYKVEIKRSRDVERIVVRRGKETICQVWQSALPFGVTPNSETKRVLRTTMEAVPTRMKDSKEYAQLTRPAEDLECCCVIC